MFILETVSEYDTTIINLAQNGEYDYFGEMYCEICWKQIGNYILTYLTSIDNTMTCVRLFLCAEEMEFDLHLSISPSYDDEYYQCIYEHTVREGKTTCLYIDKKIWQQDILEQLTI